MSKLFIKLILVGGFFTYLASYGFYKENSFRLFFYYLAISVLCFFAYGLDKYLAKKGAWRLAEKYLHFISLIGGWPGALRGGGPGPSARGDDQGAQGSARDADGGKSRD